MQINNIIKNLETKYSLKVGKNEVNNYEIKGFKGNPTQSFCFNETDLAKLEAELNRYENWTIIGDFIGFYYNDSDKNLIIQLYLNAEIPSEWIKNQLFDGVTINMNYRHKTAICNLNLLEISYETPETVIAHIQKKALEKSNGNLCSLILQEVDFESRIDDIKRWTTELKSIFHFLIFELDYNYSIQLTNFGSKIETTQLPVKSKSIKQDTILSFKKHNGVLIDYYFLADNISYLPFKFLNYYHIIEYFHDEYEKSTQKKILDSLHHFLKKPDFHIKMDEYTKNIFNITYNTIDAIKGMNEQEKTRQVIFNFLEDSDFIEIRDHLETLKLTDFFATDTRYSASMDDFIMEKIDFRAISKDLATYLKAPKDIENIATKIADRIYKMRCSIVHSNPNFVKESKSDNKGARPFLPTHENLINLDKELILLKQVVKFLISNTSE